MGHTNGIRIVVCIACEREKEEGRRDRRAVLRGGERMMHVRELGKDQKSKMQFFGSLANGGGEGYKDV